MSHILLLMCVMRTRLFWIPKQIPRFGSDYYACFKRLKKLAYDMMRVIYIATFSLRFSMLILIQKRKAEQQQQQKNKTHVNQFNCWWWQTNIRETTLHLLEFLLWWILYQNIIPIIVYKIIPPATATLFHRLNDARVLFSHNVKMYFWFCSTTHRLLWPNERERASNREKWERSNQRPMK